MKSSAQFVPHRPRRSLSFSKASPKFMPFLVTALLCTRFLYIAFGQNHQSWRTPRPSTNNKLISNDLLYKPQLRVIHPLARLLRKWWYPGSWLKRRNWSWLTLAWFRSNFRKSHIRLPQIHVTYKFRGTISNAIRAYTSDLLGRYRNGWTSLVSRLKNKDYPVSEQEKTKNVRWRSGLTAHSKFRRLVVIKHYGVKKCCYITLTTPDEQPPLVWRVFCEFYQTCLLTFGDKS